jgi:hypothetical protein
MTDSLQNAREALTRAKQADAALQMKGLAAQNIGRSLGQMALDDDLPQPNLNDISGVMIRLLTLVRDMMALSTEVVEACEGALVASHE